MQKFFLSISERRYLASTLRSEMDCKAKHDGLYARSISLQLFLAENKSLGFTKNRNKSLTAIRSIPIYAEQCKNSWHEFIIVFPLIQIR